ncbi:MAG TPA: D-2-hydroxyacid dehydrogenase [Terriglobia bacterium]|nr:D-2-hydroxyacid dehydrogenase [Terriglobia bacterium]
MKIVVLDGYTLNPGDLSWDELNKLGSVEVYDRTPQDRVVERAAGAGAVLTNKVALRESALRELNGLRYIGVMATGYDIIDIAVARTLGITTTNIPAYGTDSVAQLTIALLLELCHHAGSHSYAVRAGEWCQSQDWCFWKWPLVELAGKTLGVIGFGRIGRRVAEIAHALGMQVVASGRSRQRPPAYKEFAWASVEEIMESADAVTLHCPLTPESRGLINAERLRLMKPSAFLVNTSRGGLVVEQDLADALNEGRLAGAALDVLSSEPPAPENPLLTAKNCIITPHLAWATQEARRRLMRIATDNLRAFVEGQPQNVVSP